MMTLDPWIRIFWEGKSVGGWNEPMRRIYDHELVYVSAGEYRLLVNGSEYRMKTGSLAIIPPASWHESWTEPHKTVVRHCVHFDWTNEYSHRQAPLMSFTYETFDVSHIRTAPPSIAGYLPMIVQLECHKSIISILEMTLDHIRRNTTMRNYLLWPVLRSLLDMQTDQRTPETRGKTQRAVMMVKHYIESHYAQPIGYREFCSLVRLSKSHLCQVFSQNIGKSPVAYLNEIRINHAARLLETTSHNIAEIGRMVGIEDANYFSRLFRKTMGNRPSDFLRMK
jgi:AraC-like DNA-binding protein